MTEPESACLVCQANSSQTPLIRLQYRGESLWICPQHLPVLIHHPEQLVGKLPGAENLRPVVDQD